MRKLIVVSLTILALAALPKPADAAAIVGVLDIAGAVTVQAELDGTTTIDFTPPVGGGFGVADVQVTSTGTFAGIGGTDTLLDLNSGLFPTSGFAPVDQFQTLSALPTINFVLEDILACDELGPFVVCSAGDDSAFGFAQVGFGANVSTTVTLIMTGIVFDTLTPHLVSTWTGIFTAQFPGQTIAELLAEFSAEGFIDTSFSASKITVQQVPEPAILGLLGIALIGGGARARRRRQSAQ